MAYQIQLRRDTAANWTTNNPILASGEEGYETDTGLRKVGDGSTAWVALSYNSGGGASLTSTTPTALTLGDSGAVGDATTAARADHVHALPSTATIASALSSYFDTEGAAAAALASAEASAASLYEPLGEGGFTPDTVVAPYSIRVHDRWDQNGDYGPICEVDYDVPPISGESISTDFQASVDGTTWSGSIIVNGSMARLGAITSGNLYVRARNHALVSLGGSDDVSGWVYYGGGSSPGTAITYAPPPGGSGITAVSSLPTAASGTMGSVYRLEAAGIVPNITCEHLYTGTTIAVTTDGANRFLVTICPGGASPTSTPSLTWTLAATGTSHDLLMYWAWAPTQLTAADFVYSNSYGADGMMAVFAGVNASTPIDQIVTTTIGGWDKYVDITPTVSNSVTIGAGDNNCTQAGTTYIPDSQGFGTALGYMSTPTLGTDYEFTIGSGTSGTSDVIAMNLIPAAPYGTPDTLWATIENYDATYSWQQILLPGAVVAPNTLGIGLYYKPDGSASVQAQALYNSNQISNGNAVEHEFGYSYNGSFTDGGQNRVAGGTVYLDTDLSGSDSVYIRVRSYALGNPTPSTWVYYGGGSSPGTAFNYAAPPGGASYVTGTITTGSIANGASDDTQVFTDIGKAGQLVTLEASAACWVRLYASVADRAADTRTQAPTAGSGTSGYVSPLTVPRPFPGLLCEVLFTTETLSLDVNTPYANSETPSAAIYASVQNNSAETQAITITAIAVREV